MIVVIEGFNVGCAESMPRVVSPSLLSAEYASPEFAAAIADYRDVLSYLFTNYCDLPLASPSLSSVVSLKDASMSSSQPHPLARYATLTAATMLARCRVVFSIFSVQDVLFWLLPAVLRRRQGAISVPVTVVATFSC